MQMYPITSPRSRTLTGISPPNPLLLPLLFNIVNFLLSHSQEGALNPLLRLFFDGSKVVEKTSSLGLKEAPISQFWGTRDGFLWENFRLFFLSPAHTNGMGSLIIDGLHLASFMHDSMTTYASFLNSRSLLLALGQRLEATLSHCPTGYSGGLDWWYCPSEMADGDSDLYEERQTNKYRWTNVRISVKMKLLWNRSYCLMLMMALLLGHKPVCLITMHIRFVIINVGSPLSWPLLCHS